MGDDEALYAAAIGPGWRNYYRPRFVALAGGGRRVFWNWPAALVPFWTQYRHLNMSALLYIAFLVGVALIAWPLQDWLDPMSAALFAYVVMLVVLGVIEGATGTYWLFVQTRRKVRAARDTWPDLAVAADQLRKKAPRDGPGARVIHGLMSVFIGGWGLVAIFFPLSMAGAYDTPERAWLRIELRSLVEAERQYQARHGRFALPDSVRTVLYREVLLTVDESGPDGYRATARTDVAPRWSCVVFSGVVRDTPPGAIEDQPLCTRRRGRLRP